MIYDLVLVEGEPELEIGGELKRSTYLCVAPSFSSLTKGRKVLLEGHDLTEYTVTHVLPQIDDRTDEYEISKILIEYSDL